MSTSAGAQAPAVTQGAGTPRSVAGRCGSANWVCVAQCIDVSCVERCLAQGCEQALSTLARCAETSGCGAEDSACVARACDTQCERSFEPAPPSPEKENPDPCEDGSVGSGRVPKKMVGQWSLEAASVRPEEKSKVVADEDVKDVKPRADFERALVVTPKGCFLLRTRLESATLGKGNALEVRSWGSLVVDEKKDTVELRTTSGQAVGTVCGKPRVIGLSKGRFQRPLYQYELEGDTLGLTARTKSKQTFQFRRQPLEKAE
ncbi:hypothetical protein [Melittangium boletus]|uniref:Uncharacterized protein n=1 Tax=Melittangium boletus DSM 14713 TaxID=1294270 RepID=A0A250IIR5_9BACT|nr:hypothetical protein [Melittangium boletus]ATB31123.1 hypothetical protein MEBOL_004585 [Melittangium boletus DSM 14713]